jgi:predicted nucleic acid-binding protein
MNVYLDSSVVLRRLQRERPAAPSWARWERAFSSVLLRVEVLRTIDRNRLRGALTDSQVAGLVAEGQAIFDAIELIELSDPILRRASQSFLTALGTLDALHLSTALRLVEVGGNDLVFVTHDAELAIAARSVNFAVEGA